VERLPSPERRTDPGAPDAEGRDGAVDRASREKRGDPWGGVLRFLFRGPYPSLGVQKARLPALRDPRPRPLTLAGPR
jgi:hypothetical protein